MVYPMSVFGAECPNPQPSAIESTQNSALFHLPKSEMAEPEQQIEGGRNACVCIPPVAQIRSAPLP